MEEIDESLAHCAVSVLVIGQRWVSPDNLDRPQDKGDPVRYRIMRALRLDGVTVVPTLFESANVSDAGDLAPSWLGVRVLRH